MSFSSVVQVEENLLVGFLVPLVSYHQPSHTTTEITIFEFWGEGERGGESGRRGCFEG